uniref:polynucleotide adenylyltransferase n=1 Tax=Globodera rostochiensis TaxID=31243 RepID=A0A914IAB7_GLORO
MLKQSVFIFSSILFTLSVLLLLLLITVVAKQNDNNNVSIECPKQNVPIELLRALDMKKLPKKRFEILDEMRNEFTEILSTNFAAVPNNFVQSDVKKKLSIKVVIWHFKLIVEDSLDRIEQMEVNGNYWTANEAIKMGEEWANLLQNVNGKSMEQKICLLQAFTHRIIRNEISKTSDEWKIFVKNVARAIFSINVGSKFGYDTITTLSEEEYMEHAKKCDESEYSSNVTNKLLSLDSSYLIHRLCLHILIADSEEFQHFLCYHKNIAIYKQLFHLIMGTTELYVLEEIFPNILHIEKLSATRRLDGHFVQFHYRTGSECAIGQESRVTIRLLLGEPELIECEKAIRQKADRGTQFGRHMLDKLNAVKKAALAKAAVMSPKGICMVIKLRDFLGKHNTGVDLREEELKSVDEWWPHECDQPQEVEAVFRLQRLIANQKNRERQSYICFMALWRKLVTFPGRPTRLHKFLQLSEREIELECIYDYRYTDPKVFRSSEQLEILYTDALRTANTAHQKATKLAADIFCWVFWLEANVLELNEEQKNGKMPRFTMAWRQNRWYYEMVYDQLFDIEKADEEAELDKKRIEIDILLDKSTIFVHESLKMSDGKLKIELGTQKIKRLAQQNGTAPPPPGTLDREWYEIRRKSKAKQESVVREFEGLLQNIHFEIIKNLLSKCNKFNKEFGQRSLDALRVAAFVGEKNWDEKEIINGQSENTEKPGPNIEEQTPFDVDAALDFYVVNGSSEQTKSDETTGSEVVANEIGWTLFLRDEFLVQTYQKFFTNPTESMRQIVTIGCYINEIGHRMEVIDKFTYFNHFSLMVKQIEQDQKLRNELSNYLQNNVFTFAEIFGISLHLQEIRPFDEENFELIGDNSKSLDSLSAFLSKNGFGLISNDRKMKIDQSIKQIEQSAREWNYKAKILVTGSYVLGTLTKDSDIDVICIIPELLPAWGPQQFFGTAKCEFRRNGQRHCADKSLYCRLCLVLKVVKLNRIQDAWMPLIELKFEIDHNIFIDFDIGFAAFAPNEDIFQSNESINFQQSEALSRSLRTKFEELAYRRKEFFADAGGESYEKMMEMNLEEEKLKMKLRSLSGFEVGVKILNKLFATEHSQNDDNKIGILKTYRTLLLAVKMWAKNHHIYDNKLGFFNGISLSILAAKVMLLYPMASIPFLIEKFFFTFSTWPWPTPVKLTDLPDGSVLRWEPRDEGNKRHEIYGRLGLFADLTMPIVTPGLIEQNAIFNVNKSTATIIQREIQEAIKNIRNWPNLTISQDERWEHLLKDKNFDEKYSHFIRITCEATLLMDFDDFCGYVETRVRLQLLMDVERFDHIRLGHSKNVVEKGQFFEQSKGNKKEFFRKIWLVGLELADKIVLDDGSEVEKPVNSVEWIQRLNSMLSDQFGASIEKAYRMKKHLVGIGTLRPHIQLTCKYESR